MMSSNRHQKPAIWTGRLATACSGLLLAVLLLMTVAALPDIFVTPEPAPVAAKPAPVKPDLPNMPAPVSTTPPVPLPSGSIAAMPLPPAPQISPAREPETDPVKTPVPEHAVRTEVTPATSEPVEAVPANTADTAAAQTESPNPEPVREKPVTVKKQDKLRQWSPLGKSAARRSGLPRETDPVRAKPASPKESDSLATPADEPPTDFVAFRKKTRQIAASLPITKTTARPAPTTASAKPEKAPLPADRDRSLQQQGRVLLNLLEHGDGPGIHIDWPADSHVRDRLYALFSQCLGMKSALWTEPATLYDNMQPRGQGIAIDTSRYSLFLRAPSGSLPASEKALLRRIAHRHGAMARDARPARLFPRNLDAVLLGGLQRIIGPGYKTAQTIQASYQLHGDEIRLEKIRLDDKPVPGSLRLAKGPYYSCEQGRVL